MTTAVITTDEARQALIADEFGTGWQRWNLQAWLDFAMVKILMGRVSDVIPKTYMPILRLVCNDTAKTDADYAHVVAICHPEPHALADGEPVAFTDGHAGTSTHDGA